MELIYFDNGSTSFPKARGLGSATAEFLDGRAYNAGRGNYQPAYLLEHVIYQTRKLLASFFGCPDAKRVIFTPGITYSINYFLLGFLKPGDHIIISPLEHHAVMRPLTWLKPQGISFDAPKADEEGNVEPASIEALIRGNTKAILVTHASNVCGTMLPVKEIGGICKKHNLIFALDTAQTAGCIPVSMEQDHIDFLAFTGHKGLKGPQGIGGFLLSDRLEPQLPPSILGGT